MARTEMTADQMREEMYRLRRRAHDAEERARDLEEELDAIGRYDADAKATAEKMRALIREAYIAGHRDAAPDLMEGQHLLAWDTSEFSTRADVP